MQRRVPGTDKLARLTGLRCDTSLDAIIADVVAYERLRAGAG